MSAENDSTAWQVLLEEGPLAQAACITWVRLEPEEALRRLGAEAPFPPRSLSEVDEAVLQLDTKFDPARGSVEPIGAIADRLDGTWTLLVEPNGWAATMAASLLDLARGTEAISIFWNINALSEIAVARDEAVAVVHEVLDFVCGDEDEPPCSLQAVEGTDSSVVADLVAELADLRGYDWLPIALRWAERRVGITLPAGWLQAAHPSAVFLRPSGAGS